MASLCSRCISNLNGKHCNWGIDKFPDAIMCEKFKLSAVSLVTIPMIQQEKKIEPPKPVVNPESFIYADAEKTKCIFYSKL